MAKKKSKDGQDKKPAIGTGAEGIKGIFGDLKQIPLDEKVKKLIEELTDKGILHNIERGIVEHAIAVALYAPTAIKEAMPKIGYVWLLPVKDSYKGVKKDEDGYFIYKSKKVLGKETVAIVERETLIALHEGLRDLAAEYDRITSAMSILVEASQRQYQEKTGTRPKKK